MAVLTIIKNSFSGEKTTFNIESDITIARAINKYVKKESKETVLYETYDIKTKQTTFEESYITDFSYDIYVNGTNKNKKYKIKDDDVITIIIIPKGKFGKILTAIATGGISLLVEPIAEAFVEYIAEPLIEDVVSPFVETEASLATLAVGATLSTFTKDEDLFKSAADKAKDRYYRASEGLSNLFGSSKQKKIFTDSKTSKQRTEIEDSENQSIIGSRFPFVFGKTRVYPVEVGSTYKTLVINDYDTGDIFTGDNGVYSTTLYCIGYSPLRITDIKLKEDTISTNKYRKIMHGSLTDNLSSDSDILSKWNNNNISIEILQKGNITSGITGDSKYGTLYNKTIIDDELDADVLYIHDGSVENALIKYKTKAINDSYRTNTIRYSSEFPKEIHVELKLPDGIFATRSNTYSSSVKVQYYKIPIEVAVQWRFHRDSNPVSDARDGVGLSSYQFIFTGEVAQGDTLTFGSLVYTIKQGDSLIDAVNGLGKLVNESSSVNYNAASAVLFNEGEQNEYVMMNIRDSSRNSTEPTITSNTVAIERIGSIVPESVNGWKTFSKIQYKNSVVYPSVRTSETGGKVTYPRDTNWLRMALGKSSDTTLPDNYGWKGCQTFMLQDSSDYYDSSAKDKDEYNTNERRYDFVYTFTPAECLEMVRELNSSDPVASGCIEIRVVRLTPAYLDQTKSDSEIHSEMTYSDVTKWSRIQTVCFDKDKLINDYHEAIKDDPTIEGNIPLINSTLTVNDLLPLRDEDYNKFCLVAVKLKQDDNESIKSNYFNVVAESMSPSFDAIHESWTPVVSKKYKYYHVTYIDGKRNITYMTKSDWETAVQQHPDDLSYRYTEDGNDFHESMNSILFNNSTRLSNYGKTGIVSYKYPDNCEGYMSNNVANIFLLSLFGNHLGRDALCTNDIDMPSISELKKFCDGVTDGSMIGNEPAVIPFTCNGILVNQIRLDNFMNKILLTARAIFRKSEQNKIQVIIGKSRPMPVGAICSRNCSSISHTKYFDKYVSGFLGTYTDEDDGYGVNNIYIPADGEDYKNPTSDFVQFSLDYVTNSKQFFSLARYNLAVTNLQQDKWNCVTGKSGKIYTVGDTVILREDTIEVDGKISARITKLIQDEDYIYGFILDDAFTYTGELDDGVAKQGCSIIQIDQTGKSRYVTLRFQKPTDNDVVVDGVHYHMEVGITNLVILSKKITKSTLSTEDENALSCIVNPKIGNLVLTGIVGEEVTKCMVTDISSNNNSYTVGLSTYNEDIYNAGTKLPAFDKLINLDTFEEFKIDSEPTYLREVYTKATENANHVMSALTNANQQLPDTPINVTVNATKDTLSGFCTPVGTGVKNTIKNYKWKIKRHDGTIINISTTGVSFVYTFNRSTDGYPTAQELASWDVAVAAVSIYDLQSTWSETWAV